MIFARTLAAACVVLAAAPSLVRAEDGPVEVVQKLNAGMEGVLRQAAQLDYRARYERLTPVLDDAYDFPFMARQAVGKDWDDLKPEDQQRWTAAFRNLTNATYAGRLNRYSGQKFETLGQEEAAHDTVTVRSQVIDPGAENVDLTYRLKNTDGRWRVIDVYLKGSVSEVALRRSEYAAVLKRDGFEALLAAVNAKIATIAAGGPA